MTIKLRVADKDGGFFLELLKSLNFVTILSIEKEEHNEYFENTYEILDEEE